VLACIRIKPAPGEKERLWKPDTGKPTQKWCPIKDGIPGEKVTHVFDVIVPPADDEDEFDEDDEDEEE
jgi:hypothetical protein